jgi:hypothetical protein
MAGTFWKWTKAVGNDGVWVLDGTNSLDAKASVWERPDHDLRRVVYRWHSGPTPAYEPWHGECTSLADAKDKARAAAAGVYK